MADLRTPLEPRFSQTDLKVVGAMLSHQGLVRSGNEDFILYHLPEPGEMSRRHGALALVADGMGGHAAGEIASEIAARTVHLLFYQNDGPVFEALDAGFRAANRIIRDQSQTDPECAGMGTTCTVIAIRHNKLWLAHVGDSRAYMMRCGTLHQLSDDQTLVARMIREGLMTPDEAAASPERGVILSALGIRDVADTQIWQEGQVLVEGDVLLLCSDGLHDLVDDAYISHTLSTQAPIDACHTLIKAALAGGGHDNVSVGVFRIQSDRKEEGTAVDRDTREIDLTALAGGTA